MTENARKITLMDGGMGMELTRRSRAKHAVPLWSAQVMMDEPDLVEAVHRDFIAAGAEVLILNTYSATPRRLTRNGYGDLTAELQATAIRLARAALADAPRPVRLAGCLPPAVVSYHPEKTLPYPEALAEYRDLAAFQAPHVDLIIAETMTTIAEGVAATTAIAETGCEAWCAFTVDDADGTRLRSGEPVEAAFAAARTAGASALLVNCAAPEAVGQALARIARCLPGLDVAIGGHANGFVSVAPLDTGTTVDLLETREDLGPEAYADHVERWIAAGATIVGGCCEVGPAHIAALARRLGKPHAEGLMPVGA